MEVKPGYKQTEVGVIPNDWDAPLLGELFTFKNGLNKAKEFFGYGTPIVNYMDVYGKRGLLANDLQGRVSLSSQELKTFEVRKGDVFFTRTSETSEEVGIASVMLDVSEDTVFSGFILRARPKDDSLDDQFKKYCFSTSAVRKQITSQSTETTRALTNGRYLSTVAIARPKKPEQEAIAKALSDVDALIESLEKLNTKKRQLKQGAMQELLIGKKRLPGFEVVKGYRQTEVGLIPEDWGVAQLNGVADKITVGFVGTMAHLFRSGGVPLLRGQNVLPHKLDLSDTKYISTNTHRLWKKSMLCAGDVVMVRVGYPGTACVIPPDLGEANAASLVVVTPSTRKLDSHFLCYVVNSEFGRRQIDSYLVGGAQQVLNTATAAVFQFPLPAKAEQTAIATILSDMDAEIAASEAKLVKARQIKQGMMQELLTGRIRLA